MNSNRNRTSNALRSSAGIKPLFDLDATEERRSDHAVGCCISVKQPCSCQSGGCTVGNQVRPPDRDRIVSESERACEAV